MDNPVVGCRTYLGIDARRQSYGTEEAFGDQDAQDIPSDFGVDDGAAANRHGSGICRNIYRLRYRRHDRAAQRCCCCHNERHLGPWHDGHLFQHLLSRFVFRWASREGGLHSRLVRRTGIGLASGHGTYLDALAALAGHEGQAQQRFVTAVRAGFAKLVAAPDYHEQNRFAKAEALYNLVNGESESITKSTTPVNNG
jgi:hypothetical protein